MESVRCTPRMAVRILRAHGSYCSVGGSEQGERSRRCLANYKYSSAGTNKGFVALELQHHFANTPTDPPPSHDLAKLLASNGVPGDGCGADLVNLTEKLWELGEGYNSTDHDTLKQSRVVRRRMWREDMIQEGLRFADMFHETRNFMKQLSALCEHPDCTQDRCMQGPSMKRCSECLQVIYCSVECQHQDRARHQAFCKRVNRNNMRKDVFGRMLRTFAVHPIIRDDYESYAASVYNAYKAASDRSASWMLDFGFSLVPDPVHKPGEDPQMYMLQISSVKKKQVPWADGGTGATNDPENYINLHMDIEGATATQFCAVSNMLSARIIERPVFHLMEINLFIREDVDNDLHLRIPRSFLLPEPGPDLALLASTADEKAVKLFRAMLNRYGDDGAAELLRICQGPQAVPRQDEAGNGNGGEPSG